MTPSEPSNPAPSGSQCAQRVRVAMTGLAAVTIFIGVGSAVFNYASTEPPVTAVGAAKPDVVANLADVGVVNSTAEPLAELGIAPGPVPTIAAENVVAPAQ